MIISLLKRSPHCTVCGYPLERHGVMWLHRLPTAYGTTLSSLCPGSQQSILTALFRVIIPGGGGHGGASH
jgi:hypothetical protein